MAALQLLTVAVVGTVLKLLADHYKTSRNASRGPETLRVFEGLGAASGWELTQPRAAKIFDFKTLLDVKVVFDLRDGLFLTTRPTASFARSRST